MSFSKQLTAFVSGTKEKIDKTVKGATVVLATNVITETPVDEGTARGNWQTSVGQPKTDILDRLDPSGQQAMADAAAAIPDEAGQVVYLANNAKHIRKLEYGHSQQAPGGMVRVNAAKWPQIVESEAAKHK